MKEIIESRLLGLSVAAVVVLAGLYAFGSYEKSQLAATVITQDQFNIATSTAPLSPDSSSSEVLYQYIEVTNSCGPYYDGSCVIVRSGPGTNFPAIAKLRTGEVLKVQEQVVANGETWYVIAFDEELRYPERVTQKWHVSAEVVTLLYDDGEHVLDKGGTTTDKRIVVDISEQMLYAYDRDLLFMQEPISTGLEFTPTPRGTFKVYKMTPTRYMQGPIPEVSDQYYDLPGVPWNLYFTAQGAVIHGAYWHNSFGQPWSHGCVNLPPQKAKELYLWADIGTTVVVQQ